MKRYLTLAAALLSALCLSAQEIRTIDIDVYINGDGDAYIVQNWDVNVVRGTEWYIPISAWKGGRIGSLTVEENGEEFIDEKRDWNTQRSIEEKAGRSGIVDKGKDGVELCWGLGTLGDHQWKAGFVALGLVQSLKDYDAFNFMFINPEMVAAPQHASIRFHRLDDVPFTEEETRWWVFGCSGESQLMDDGTIFFETDEPFRRNSRLIVMMRFDKGFFNATNERNFKFAKMQKKAFKGSDYSNKKKTSLSDIIALIVGWAFAIVIVGLVLLVVFLIIWDLFCRIIGRTWRPKYFGSSRPTGWYRNAPFGGDIPTAVYLMKEGTRLVFKSDHPERWMGAYFLKWISDGIVKPVKAKDGHYDLAFPETAPELKDNCERHLFAKSVEAAGENRILENGEFKAWANKHSTSLANWPNLVEKDGKANYAAFGGDKVLEGKRLLQFKNFLSEFTLSRDREVPEVGLWGQYLVYAQLFGIADKVTKGLSKLYPNQFADYSRSLGVEPSVMSTVLHTWSVSNKEAYATAYSKYAASQSSGSSRSSGGFGGHSSFGGGGGFSGGGFGGGSR
jgi:hypothetical protein